MNRKSGSEGGYRPSFEGKTHRNTNVRTNADAEGSARTDTTTVPEDIKQPETNVQRQNLPEPPPNYRGMIYDSFSTDDVEAEGLDRLVKNDISYSDYEKKRREDEYRKNKIVSAMGRNVLREPDNDTNGLERLVEGLKTKKFSSEDILLCAMILLMLNSGSDDDILMVLVLMMLL